MPTEKQWAAARARTKMSSALREYFGTRGYLEVETPILVPTPGLEPHIDPFELEFIPQTNVGRRRPLYLHTSPEYAMKRLLADPGCPPLFQLCKVFRNGEVSEHHNPEFTLLEFYRPNADYHAIMDDLEGALAHAERSVTGAAAHFGKTPWERISVRDALLRETGVDWRAHPTAEGLRAAAEAAGIRVGGADSWDDVFFHLFLQKVEPKLGQERPTFLLEYPAAMASLARLKPGDPGVAERVELYARGVELGNGFSELTDAAEQRARLQEEQALRTKQGRPAFPIDEKFLEAVGRMPPSGGIAVGLDRVLMLLLQAEQLADVLLFPAGEFL
jgi:elongation factor P--(R)-beta-lysine ligase